MTDADFADPGALPPPPPPPRAGNDRRGVVLLAVVVALLVVAAGVVVATAGGDDDAAAEVVTYDPFPRDLTAYEGLGAWIDVYDYVPAYSGDVPQPVLAVGDVAVLAAQGVRTIYLQAARLDDRTPAGLVDATLLGPILEAAHTEGLRVVAWYLPKFADVDADMARIEMLHTFTYGEHRFDGLAIDIEYTGGVPDPLLRGQRLVELSQRARALVGTDALAAIVLPPVLTEVVNQAFWPAFPWTAIGGLYDIWMPMTYWTDRREDSGYRNGFTYVEESVRRLRANIGRPNAPVHPVGGIGDQVTERSLREYLEALVATRARGGSVYDVRTMSGGAWGILRDGVPAALAASGAVPTTVASVTTG